MIANIRGRTCCEASQNALWQVIDADESDFVFLPALLLMSFCSALLIVYTL